MLRRRRVTICDLCPFLCVTDRAEELIASFRALMKISSFIEEADTDDLIYCNITF